MLVPDPKCQDQNADCHREGNISKIDFSIALVETDWLGHMLYEHPEYSAGKPKIHFIHEKS